MRFGQRLFAVAMSLMLGGAGLGAHSASAESIDAWMTVATNRPAIGCVVDTSVQVQAAGAPMAGAEVSIILSDDATSAVIDSMTTTTDASGVAWLSFDTSGAAVEKTWLEVRVNGGYLGGRTIMINGDSCAGAESVLDLSGDVPTVTDTFVPVPDSGSTSAGTVQQGGGTFLPLVTYTQQRNLSCEYAAVQIATTMIGAPLSEYDIEAVTPLNENPHFGYRGVITGWWGNTEDYGVYANALVPGLQAYGYGATSFYGDANDLTAAIDNGTPVIVWLGMRGDQSYDAYAADGSRFQLTYYMHVMVVYGYDESGVYLADPATGGTRFYDWATFNSMWDVMDGMGLVVGG